MDQGYHLGDYPAALQQALEEVQCPLSLPADHMAGAGVHGAGPGQTPILFDQLLDQTDVVPVTKHMSQTCHAFYHAIYL